MAKELVDHIEAASARNSNDDDADLRTLIGKWSLESGARIAYGKRLGCLDMEGKGEQFGRRMVKMNLKIFKV